VFFRAYPEAWQFRRKKRIRSNKEKMAFKQLKINLRYQLQK
jgi:hypothetical protein